MEELFLKTIQALSNSRFWLAPLLLICAWIAGIKMMVETIKNMKERKKEITNV